MEIAYKSEIGKEAVSQYFPEERIHMSHYFSVKSLLKNIWYLEEIVTSSYKKDEKCISTLEMNNAKMDRVTNSNL